MVPLEKINRQRDWGRESRLGFRDDVADTDHREDDTDSVISDMCLPQLTQGHRSF